MVGSGRYGQYGPAGGGPPDAHAGGPVPRRGQEPPPSEQHISSLVRPYAVTGGRTQPRYDLPVEALVSVAPYSSRDPTTLTPEYQAIIDLCRDWRSVAEVAALLRLPLGVTRVLVADMTYEGLLRLNQPSFDEGRPEFDVLERVLSGLRKL